MTGRTIVTFNAGSSSLRCALFDIAGDATEPRLRMSLRGLPEAMIFERRDADGAQERTLTPPDTPDEAQQAARSEMTGRVLDLLAEDDIAAFAHRVVHGGPDHRGPVAVTAEVLADLEALSPLAPGHQPHNLAAIRDLRDRFPSIPHVASFDTAFHATLPRNDRIFALPQDMTEAGIRRYGFHGLSYDHVAGVLSQIAPEIAQGRVIVAHLGHGVSMCALREGRSIATTMGMTALDGLPMGKRSGALDPGIVLHLIEDRGMSPAEVRETLYENSGLLGLSGISSEMKELLESDADGARGAVDFFVHRCHRTIGSLAAALGGLDALVFTGGMGEHAPAIRSRVAEGLGWLGVTIDPSANRAGARRLSAGNARVAVFLVPTDEERVLARDALAVLTADPDQGDRNGGG